MSKVIRTGTIYRMVGMVVAVIVMLAIAVPKIAGSMIAQADAQDAEVAARPEAAASVAPPPPAARPIAAPQAPVIFGAPTMPAAPVDHAKLQQQSQSTPAPSVTNPTPTPSTAPSYQPTAPAPSSDLGVDPNVTAPRVIPPQPQKQSNPAAPRGTGKRVRIE